MGRKLHQNFQNFLGRISKTAALSATSLGALLWFTAPAQANLQVCNKSSAEAYIAVGYSKNQRWISEGWFQVQPGQCAVVLEGDLTALRTYYYLYGASSDNRTAIWAGDRPFCVHPTNAFSYSVVGNECGASGSRLVDFWEVDPKNARSFTVDLAD